MDPDAAAGMSARESSGDKASGSIFLLLVFPDEAVLNGLLECAEGIDGCDRWSHDFDVFFRCDEFVEE